MPVWNDELRRALARGRPPGRPGDARLLNEVEKVRDQMLSQVMGREEYQVTPTARIPAEQEKREEKEVVQSMPRRKIEVGSDAESKEPIFTWAFASSRPHGGQVVNYETRLTKKGDLMCNCPGWIFCKVTKNEKGKDIPKMCTHTKRVAAEALEIAKKYKNGEELPVLEAVGAVSAGATASGKAASSKIKHGRLIEL